MAKKPISFAPQEGKQTLAFNTKVDVLIYGGSAGCVDKDTEFFNGTMWKNISDYTSEDCVLQFDPVNNRASLVKDNVVFHKYPAETLTLIETRAVNQCLSDEHKVLYYNENGSYHVQPFSVIKERHNKSKTKGFTGKFKTTFDYSGEGLDMTEGELQLQVAVMADGRVVLEGKDNYTQMRFAKERKYNRLIELCQKNQLKFDDRGFKESDRYLSGKAFEVIVWPKYKDKIFDSKYYKCSNEQLQIIIDEIGYWDGCFADNQNTKTIRYSTNHKANADFIQFAAASCGYNTSISKDKRTDKYSTGKHFTVNIYTRGNGFKGIANKDGKVEFKEYKTLDGFKYCFTVPTGFFVMRRKGKIAVTGNSGKSRLLLLKALAHAYNDPYFEGVIFRRTSPPLRAAGGLFSEAKKLYSSLNPHVREKDMEILFKNTKGGNIKFTHLENENDAEGNHQGLQYSMVGFDEL